MSDQFAAWGKLLALAQQHKTKAALRAAIGESGLIINETEPLSGYYRCAAVKDGPLLPVAIWREAGTLIVLRGGEPVALERVWPYSVWTPISYEWYEGAIERGEKWPDAAAEAPAEARADNGTKPVEDEVANLKRTIETTITASAIYATINSDDEANAAQAMRSKLNALASDTDKRRKVLLYPFEQEVKKINEALMPLVKVAKGAADGLRDGPIKTWLNRPQPQPEPVEAITVPAADGDVPRTHNEPPAATEPQAQPSATVLKGATGRAAPIHTNQIAVVTDYDALYQHAKAFPEVKATLDRIAQRLVDAGNKAIPGVEIKEERSAA